MPSSPNPAGFEAQVALSRKLHGHKYVFPVAAWIALSGASTVNASDAMVGLEGRADRPRILEALERLAGIGAMAEMARPDQRNSPRYFQKVEDPYWSLVESHLRRLEAQPSSGEGRFGGP